MSELSDYRRMIEQPMIEAFETKLRFKNQQIEKMKPVIKLVLDLLDSGATFYESAIERGAPYSIDFDEWQQKMLKALERMTR